MGCSWQRLTSQRKLSSNPPPHLHSQRLCDLGQVISFFCKLWISIYTPYRAVIRVSCKFLFSPTTLYRDKDFAFCFVLLTTVLFWFLLKEKISRKVGRRHSWVARMDIAKWTRSNRREVVSGWSNIGTSHRIHFR